MTVAILKSVVPGQGTFNVTLTKTGDAGMNLDVCETPSSDAAPTDRAIDLTNVRVNGSMLTGDGPTWMFQTSKIVITLGTATASIVVSHTPFGMQDASYTIPLDLANHDIATKWLADSAFPSG